MRSQILRLFFLLVFFFGLLLLFLVSFLDFLLFRFAFVGDLLVDLAYFLNTLRHLVRCESRVCSEADLSLGFELLVEPDSEFLDFVAQILTLFAGDPGLLFQDSRDRVLPLLQATLHLP